MTNDLWIAPSILSADFAHLAKDIEKVEKDADWIHVDVMDNHFVPNLTLGLPVVRSLVSCVTVPLDCHLMINNPDRWAPEYAECAAGNVTFHAEATANPVSVARDIRAAGALAGLAVKPGTALDGYLDILSEFNTILIMTVEPGFGGQKFIHEVIPKIKQAREHISSGHLQIRLEVDGGINADTIALAAHAGADVFVAGSAVYSAQDPAAAIVHLRDLARK